MKRKAIVVKTMENRFKRRSEKQVLYQFWEGERSGTTKYIACSKTIGGNDEFLVEIPIYRYALILYLPVDDYRQSLFKNSGNTSGAPQQQPVPRDLEMGVQ